MRAAGGGLFSAAPALNTQEIAAKVTEIKETELELSRGIWRAVDAATAAATDAVAPLAGLDLSTGLRAAFDGAIQAVPEPVRERVTALVDAVLANEELVRAIDSVPDVAWVLVLVATVGSKALGGGSSATAGMDEWAALAAAEGDEEPIELQNYDPDAIYAHFKRRPLVLLRRGLRSGSLLGGYGFRLWLDRKILGEDPPGLIRPQRPAIVACSFRVLKECRIERRIARLGRAERRPRARSCGTCASASSSRGPPWGRACSHTQSKSRTASGATACRRPQAACTPHF